MEKTITYRKNGKKIKETAVIMEGLNGVYYVRSYTGSKDYDIVKEQNGKFEFVSEVDKVVGPVSGGSVWEVKNNSGVAFVTANGAVSASYDNYVVNVDATQYVDRNNNTRALTNPYLSANQRPAYRRMDDIQIDATLQSVDKRGMFSGDFFTFKSGTYVYVLDKKTGEERARIPAFRMLEGRVNTRNGEELAMRMSEMKVEGVLANGNFIVKDVNYLENAYNNVTNGKDGSFKSHYFIINSFGNIIAKFENPIQVALSGYIEVGKDFLTYYPKNGKKCTVQTHGKPIFVERNGYIEVDNGKENNLNSHNFVYDISSYGELVVEDNYFLSDEYKKMGRNLQQLHGLFEEFYNYQIGEINKLSNEVQERLPNDVLIEETKTRAEQSLVRLVEQEGAAAESKEELKDKLVRAGFFKSLKARLSDVLTKLKGQMKKHNKQETKDMKDTVSNIQNLANELAPSTSAGLEEE